MIGKKNIVSKKEFERLFPEIVDLTKKSPRGPLKGKISDLRGKIISGTKNGCLHQAVSYRKFPLLPLPSEASEGKTFKSWADYHPIAKDRLFHIPNGGSRHPLEAKNLKAQGTKCGVSDYFFAYPHNGKHGLFIELKRRSRSLSRLTVEQAAWLAASERLGYATKVAYGAEEAIRAVEDYLK